MAGAEVAEGRVAALGVVVREVATDLGAGLGLVFDPRLSRCLVGLVPQIFPLRAEEI